jgi:hypothetical protein
MMMTKVPGADDRVKSMLHYTVPVPKRATPDNSMMTLNDRSLRSVSTTLRVFVAPCRLPYSKHPSPRHHSSSIIRYSRSPSARALDP